MQLARGRSDVESILVNGYEIAQLLEFHRLALGIKSLLPQ
jgi:hypothetical protein